MLILHITKREAWQAAKTAGVYRGDTLESDGFIHCSTPLQVVRVANALFGGVRDLVRLCIEPDRVQAEVRYEEVGGERYPHIYGPLNLDAVVKVLNFEPDEEGRFALPEDLDSPAGLDVLGCTGAAAWSLDGEGGLPGCCRPLGAAKMRWCRGARPVARPPRMRD